VAGGNTTNVSVLTVNNATANYFAGSLGGSAAPANELALVMGGTSNLTLTGTNTCVGGFTVNAGTLTFGDGSSSDSPISGPITNNAAVVFDPASSQTYAGVINGAGSVTVLGNGVLTLSGTNTYTGPTLVSAGKLVLTTASTGQGAVAATTGGEFNVAVVPAAASLTNASLTLGAYTYDYETIGFNFGGNSPGATAPMVVGSLINNGSTSINLLNFGPLSLGSFPLIKYNGYVSNANSAFNLNSPGSGVTASIQNDAVNHSIDLVITALNSLKWTGATDTNWDTITINWLNAFTLTGTSYADGDFVRFDDSGNNTAVNLTFSPQPGFIVVSNAAKAYSFNGNNGLAGSAALLKQGTGTLTVAVNNDNTGGTFIQTGTLQVGDGISADGTITSPITDNGSLVFNVLNSDISGGITGTGMVTKAGSGTLTLGNGSTYAGGTLVQAGRLYATDSSALGAGTNGATVLTGSELWMDQAALTIAQPLVIGGAGVNGAAGAFNVTAAASGSTWSGNIKATANPTVFSAAASTVTLSGSVNGGTNVLNFAPLTGGNFIVSSNLTAGQVVLNGLSGATAVGGLNLSGANNTLTNSQVLLSVAPGSSPPATDGLWAYNNLALGTNCSVVLTNGQHIGDTGTRLGLGNNVSIPAGVSLTAYSPGTGYEGVGGYRCTFTVATSTTNIWNGPIFLHGADPSLGVSGIFTLYGGNSGTSGRLVVNGNITVLDGVVTLVVRGASSGQLNGQINLGTNAFTTTDTALWTVCSQGNLWGLTTIGSGRSLQLGTNNALPTSTTVSFNLAAGTATGWDLNGFNQQVAGLANSGAYSAAEGIVENLNTNSDSTLTFNSATNFLFDGQLIGGTTRKLNLVVAGGTLALSSPLNNYAGSTTIAGGATLALVNDTSLSASLLGNLTASTPIDVQAGGTFNVSGTTNGGFTLGAGRMLQGNGTVNGSLLVSGTVAPGESAFGQLTVTTNVTLGGTAWMAVNNTLGTNGLLNVGGTLTYRGILVITNVSGTAYTNNQVLKLFNAPSGQYTGAFTNIVFPGVTAYNTNNLVVNGTVQVVSVIPPVNPNPTNITATVSNGNLNLFWPADHTGWRLLVQTNHLAAGISLNTNDWMTVAGSAATNQMFIPIVTTNQNEFYRLVYP